MQTSRLLYANGAPGQHAASYYAATANGMIEHPPLTGSHSFDICVVGAGFTGLSSALHLAERGYRIVVVDAHRVGWGASGRNGGQVGSGQRLEQDQLEKLVGLEDAKKAFQIGIDAASLVRELINKHRIDCGYRPGIIHANHRRRFDTHSKWYAEHLNRTYGYDTIRHLSADEMAAEIASPHYYGGTLDIACGHLHPLNFALGLMRAAIAAGVTFHEQSEVTNIEDDGGRLTVSTATGRVDCNTAILACNGYLDARLGDLYPAVGAKVMPINNFMVASEPLGEDGAHALITNSYAVADSRFVVNYFRISDDYRLLFGGGERYSYRFPTDIKGFVRPYMLQVFPQLKDIRLDYGWGGTLAITGSRLPHIQRISDRVYSASGYSGSGVAMATMAGQILSEAIDGQMARFDVMGSMPTRAFPGGSRLRAPLLAMAMFWYGLRDRL